MTNRNLALTGAGLLVVGLFVPIVSLPIVGSVNLFGNGSNLVATIILALSLIAGVLALKGREAEVIWPASASTVLIAVLFLNLQFRISQMKASMDVALKDNPFAGIAQAAANAVQVQWGWLILAAGAGLLLYAAIQASKEAAGSPFAISDSVGRGMAATSIVLVVAGVGLTFWDRSSTEANSTPSLAKANAAGSGLSTNPEVVVSDTKSDQQEVDYIRDNLTIYDTTAKYYNSLLDGRIPGVEFKIKNNGNRTLSEVDVRVEFLDSAGKPIAEETYYPVLAQSYTGDSTPLRPNYIWKQEQGQFYSAKSVPDEWDTGSVRTTISDIEFAPKE